MKRLLVAALMCGWATASCLGTPSLDFRENGNPESICMRRDKVDARAAYAELRVDDAESGLAEPIGVTATDPVSTIRIPAPGALLLASLGAAAVGWLRIRRSL